MARGKKTTRQKALPSQGECFPQEGLRILARLIARRLVASEPPRSPLAVEGAEEVALVGQGVDVR